VKRWQTGKSLPTKIMNYHAIGWQSNNDGQGDAYRAATSARYRPERCKICTCPIEPRDEDTKVTYRDGTCAHESCHDEAEYDCANAADIREVVEAELANILAEEGA